MLIKELTLFQTPETTHSTNKFLSCRLNLFLKGFYNGGMKFFPSSLLALAPIIITLLCEAKALGNTTVTKRKCKASKKELRSVSNDGPFKGDLLHPIVVRDFGSNWSDSGVGSAPTTVSDPFGLVTDLYKNMGGATHERYRRWSESTAGTVWLELQGRLQALNPTLETTAFN